MHREDGKPQRQSALEAGISRLRPILMTALATIAGMVPIALELGAGSEERSPMAIAVIGGFTTSTLLTLVVVPVIFTYIDGFQNWLRTRLACKSYPTPNNPAPESPVTPTINS
jgi:multidrug efflux pump subunit AcrB